MKNFSNDLIRELEVEIANIQSRDNNPIVFLEQAICCTIKALEKLKTHFKKHKLETKKEEIEFFKEIKPQLTSKLISFNNQYKIEINKPNGNKKQIKKYYKKEIKKRNNFFLKNAEFYKYYKTKNTCFDKKYFIRRRYDIKLTLENHYFQSDKNFSTSHDYLVAKIIANEEIIEFLKAKLKKETEKRINTSMNLQWTGTKVALVELTYALHNNKVLNNGNTSLNECVKAVESFFNIEIKQHNRIFLEIRNRKTIQKTNFLNNLSESLNKKMNELDS